MVMTKKSEEAKEMRPHSRPKQRANKVKREDKMEVPRMGGEPKMMRMKKDGEHKKHHVKKESASHEKAEMKHFKALEKMHKHLGEHLKKHGHRKGHKGK